jgi:predicted regulator of Ras-like GTPase activity (Roadblock/LC7/MglB family)
MTNPAVQQILDKQFSNIAGVRGAVVLSEDGLHKYWSLWDEKTAEKRAPLASTLGLLAERTADEEDGGSVRRTLIEMDGGYFIVARCARHSFVAVSARKDADLGRVGYELTLLAQRLATVLDTASRRESEGGALA